MPQRIAFRRWPLRTLLLPLALGCADPGDDGPKRFDPDALVPVGGVVTLNGAPIAGAVVTFIPDEGFPGVSDTDRNGHYDLRSVDTPGVVPGDHRVAISQLVSPDGVPQGLAQRNASTPSPAMQSARERLPAEYSDNFRTRQRARVTARGGTFNFAIEAAIPPLEDGSRAPATPASGEPGPGRPTRADVP